jgi:hypothetical protein
MDFNAFRDALPSSLTLEGEGFAIQRRALGEALRKLARNHPRRQVEHRTKIIKDAYQMALGQDRADAGNIQKHLASGEGAGVHALVFYYYLNRTRPPEIDLTALDAILVPGQRAPLVPNPGVVAKEEASENLVLEFEVFSSPTDRWLSPRNLGAIPLVGRDEELRELDAFAAAPEPFLTWGIVGPIGAGKTRLAVEWLSQRKSDGWHVGFLDASEIGNIDKWVPTLPTLIVLDVPILGARALAAILNRYRVLAESSGVAHPIRVLVIDRWLPKAVLDYLDNPYWSAIAPNEAALLRFRNMVYRPSPMNLGDTKIQGDVFRALVGSRKDTSVTRTNDFFRVPTPLAGILRARAVLSDNQPYMKGYSVTDLDLELVETFFAGPERLPWRFGGVHGEYAGCYVFLAQIIGRISFSKFDEFLPEDMTFLERETIRSICLAMIGDIGEQDFEDGRSFAGYLLFLSFLRDLWAIPRNRKIITSVLEWYFSMCDDFEEIISTVLFVQDAAKEVISSRDARFAGRYMRLVADFTDLRYWVDTSIAAQVMTLCRLRIGCLPGPSSMVFHRNLPPESVLNFSDKPDFVEDALMFLDAYLDCVRKNFSSAEAKMRLQQFIEWRWPDGRSVIHFACYNDRSELVKWLVDLGADVHLPDNDGRSGLYFAALSHKPSAIRGLLSMGVHPNPVYAKEIPVLSFAMRQADQDLVGLLRDHGADITDGSELVPSTFSGKFEEFS